MFLWAVSTLILTAPIHCRGSIGEQVMKCYISPLGLLEGEHIFSKFLNFVKNDLWDFRQNVVKSSRCMTSKSFSHQLSDPSASGSDRSMLVFWCTSYRLWRAVLNISAAGSKTLCVRLHWNVGNSFGSVRIEQEKEAVRASCLSYFCLVRARGHSVWGKEEFCSALHLVSPLKPFYELVWASARPWWHTVLSVVEKILRHKPEKESWHLPWQAIMFCILCFLVLW